LGAQPAPKTWPNEPLAYIEWYSKLDGAADAKHGLMYHIKKACTTSNPARVQGVILPLGRIRQSCMLFPTFPAVVPVHWSTTNVLDHASSFLVNNWLSKYSYQSIW